MKKFISLTLKKGGKQSILSMNKGEKYKNVGSVRNSHNVTVRVPINTRLRVAFNSLRVHLLAVSGYLSSNVLEKYNFEEDRFEDGLKGKEYLHAQRLLQDLKVNYCYVNNGEMKLSGNLFFLGSSRTFKLSTPKITIDDEYEYMDLLEEACEELSDAAMEWYDNRDTIDRKQMALSFLEIEDGLDQHDAQKLWDSMPEDEKDAIVNKHMTKFLEEAEAMVGADSDEGSETAEEEEKEEPVAKKEKPEKSKKSDSKKTKPKVEKVEAEEDPFGNEEEGQVIPMIE